MTELATLLRRDHRELDLSLLDLARPTCSMRELCDAIDGVRLGLLAHDEAEDIVLSRVLADLPESSPLHLVVARTRTEHLHAESALSALVCTAPGTATWVRRIDQLRALIADHCRREMSELVPQLATELPAGTREKLAGAFATARLCQLAMLQPSAPIRIPHDPHDPPELAAMAL
jgi:Hemerythrin HHE cation binding domain